MKGASGVGRTGASVLERFLSSHGGRCAILPFLVLLMFGFGYHVAHNLKRAGMAKYPPVEVGRPSSGMIGNQKPQP
jgi:hypothetical protein